MSERMTKLIAGGYKEPVRVVEQHGRAFLHFGYNKALINIVKNNFEGRKYHGFEDPPQKVWSIPLDSEHNQFQLAYLEGRDPYARWTLPVIPVQPTRPIYDHQAEGMSWVLARRHGIYAGEMGVGKTLMAIEVIEKTGYIDCWYVAPKSALVSAKIDFRKWNAQVEPHFMTYEGMVKRVENWRDGDIPPRIVIFDEGSRLKTPTSKRSQAAYHLAKSIRKEHGFNSIILIMSGSPAPKAPGDWWSLMRIVCPGYLTDGSLKSFQERYALMRTEDYGTGAFNRLVTWRDTDKKCNRCGEQAVHDAHDQKHFKYDHDFAPMENEVVKLYKRMAGAVVVKFKKDCLSLPDKIYRIIRVDVAPETKRAAMLLRKGCKTVIEALTRCRELSDGFQYLKEPAGTETCSLCKGHRLIQKPVYNAQGENQFEEVPCHFCDATGEIKKWTETTKEFPCGKDEALEEILEDHEDDGRLVVYAGFTASIDRVVRVCERNGWNVIRVDGRGTYSAYGTFEESVVTFQDRGRTDKIVFIGHPGSAGMGLTLTASRTIVYWSNDFRAESRIQSEDRIHRAGMDVNRGCNIIDLIGLETDLYVLDNLKKKRELQSITLGELNEASLSFETADVEFR